MPVGRQALHAEVFSETPLNGMQEQIDSFNLLGRLRSGNGVHTLQERQQLELLVEHIQAGIHFCNQVEAGEAGLLLSSRPASSQKPLLSHMNTILSGLRQSLDCCDSLRAPVWSIPIEILVEVFKYACSDGVNLGLDCSWPGAPFYLASVCTHWRSIALGIGSIWASNTSPSEAIRLPSSHIRMYELLLLRSLPSILDITFEPGSPRHQSQIALVKALKPHMQRISRLTINLPLLIPYLSIYFRNLTELHLYTSRENETMPELKAPMLRSLSLNTPGDAFSRFKLPWAQIEELNVCQVSVSELSALLHSCPYLKTLELYDADICDFPSPVEELLAPTVTHLRIVVEDPDESNAHADLISLLRLPGLNTIDVRDIQPVSMSWMLDPLGRGIQDMIQKSGCRVIHLILQNVNITHGEVQTLLEVMPSLTSLVFHTFHDDFTRGSSDLFMGLVAGQDSKVEGGRGSKRTLVPCLTSIDIEDSGRTLPDSSLLRLLRSRSGQSNSPGVAVLQNVRVKLRNREIDRTICKSIKQCISSNRFRIELVDSNGLVDL